MISEFVKRNWVVILLSPSIMLTTLIVIRFTHCEFFGPCPVIQLNDESAHGGSAPVEEESPCERAKTKALNAEIRYEQTGMRDREAQREMNRWADQALIDCHGNP